MATGAPWCVTLTIISGRSRRIAKIDGWCFCTTKSRCDAAGAAAHRVAQKVLKRGHSPLAGCRRWRRFDSAGNFHSCVSQFTSKTAMVRPS
jgi:hypothetical protein